jgi:predicted acyl esterase
MCCSQGHRNSLMAEFFDRYREGAAAGKLEKSIQYYVNGAGAWRTSSTWPPTATSVRRWYLGALNTHRRRQLQPDQSTIRQIFSQGTRKLSGYRGQVDLSKTDYGNRASVDARLLIYTAAPASAGKPMGLAKVTQDSGRTITGTSSDAPVAKNPR